MKLVKQTVLVFSEGRSEKVYEVDLCEVGTNQFVVNFRYGKRGAALKDGSKTVAPVSRTEADKVFDKLVQTKIEQGYVREGEAAPRPPPPRVVAVAPPPRAPGTVPASQDPRASAILQRLAFKAERGWFRRASPQPKWPLDRAIWRAGELAIREAEPLLLALVGTAPPNAKPEDGGRGVRDYAIAWSLGFVGSEKSVSTLGRLYGDQQAPEHVRRIAGEALLKLSDEATREEFRRDQIEALPGPLAAAAKSGDPQAFAVAFAAYLVENGTAGLSMIDRLYLVDGEVVRPSLFSVLDACFRPGVFRHVRRLFKAAEYRRDAEAFGILAHKFEKISHLLQYRNPEHTIVNPFTRVVTVIRDRQPVVDRAARGVYGRVTRDFLRRRVWRTLRRLGEAGDPAYVRMAVGVLLPFTDEDAVPTRTSFAGRDRLQWDKFAPYLAFNHVLYANSPRYQAGKRAFRLRPGHSLGGLPPPAREEAFPALWEQNPAALMHLLSESRCTPVHEFGARALAACTAFCESLDVDDVVMLLGRPYEPTAKLGFLLARKRWDPTHPNRELLLALARCSHQAARTQAFTWIDEQRMQLLSEGAFLASLVAAPFEDTRAFARRFLRSATLAVPVARALMGRLVAELVALGPGAEALANDVVQTVLTTLSAHLAGVGVSIIRDLLAHPLGAVQELGAELLLRHDARSGIIPEEILMGILRSPHPNVRAVGMRLIGELDDDTLIAMDPLLLHLSTDANADIRNAVRPVVKRVVASHPEVGVGIATGLVESLLRRRLAEDVPSHVLRVLKEDLSRSLARLSREMVWQLLQSASPHAQELGGILLPSHLDASAMEIDQIVRLASHEILSVRMASWAMCERIVPRLAADMPSAVRILDAKWADSRAWAFEFFRIKMPDSAFSAQAIITIVDSVREDVQAFGRELLQKHFKEEDGPELLRKLSEHPGRSVQLFGTNYLDRYAGGHVDEIERLSPYFTSVLSRVNQGRVAKSRVLAFLRREGLRTEECARLVMGLLHRLSATIAIEDRGTAIETMTALHRAWPAVPVPLRVKPVEVRKAKGAA